MKRKIYEKNLGYDLLKPYVDYCTRHSYRKVEVRGLENVPREGAVILAPNHCNTLMDALVMLRSFKTATVFGARADMFNNPTIASIMYFLRILPMVRQRDGLRNVLKNRDTQETIVETLENGVRFCIYPEGRHRAAHSLLPLGKGVFRAALAANAKFGDRMPVYIVPVGIEYGDYFRYRSTSLANFGEPINVTEYIKGIDTENEAQMMEPLRKELTLRMSSLMTYIKDDGYLEQKWALTRIMAIDRKKGYGCFGTSLHDDMLANRLIVEKIESALEKHPDEMKEFFDEVMIFEKKRRKYGISIYSFRKTGSLAADILKKTFAALLGLPYFVFSAAASLPLWLTSSIIRKKVKDKAFRNTVNLGVRLAGNLIWLPVWIITAFCLAPWWVALVVSVLAIPSYSYFHDYLEGMRRYISDIRLAGNRKMSKFYRGILKEALKLTSDRF